MFCGADLAAALGPVFYNQVFTFEHEDYKYEESLLRQQQLQNSLKSMPPGLWDLAVSVAGDDEDPPDALPDWELLDEDIVSTTKSGS